MSDASLTTIHTPAGEPSLFDSLSRLVPEELQKQYYRVLAHTRTLGPDDEMLRILEAMGVLALLTRSTPADIACERERIAVLLSAHTESSANAKEELLRYADKIDARIEALPKEIEAGLNPQAISKQLSESLRQYFAESGIKDTALALHQTAGALQQIQKTLSSSYVGISESHRRTVSHVESANSSLIYAMESRLKTLDALVHEFKSDLLQIWLPVVVGAALILGVLSGMGLQSRIDNHHAATEGSIPIRRGN